MSPPEIDVEAMAAEVVLLMKSALDPVIARQAVQDAKHDALQAQLAAWEARWSDLGALRERVAVMEARPQLPGPQGEKGEPGLNGKDGAAGLRYRGVWQDRAHEPGDVVTWAGAAWHCDAPTTTKPGDVIGAAHWTLMVKRGRDGRDGKDFTPPVVPIVAVGSRQR